MSQNGFSKLYTKVKDILLYTTPTEPQRFVLGEGQDDTWEKSTPPPATLVKELEQALSVLLSFSRRLEAFIQEAKYAIEAGEWERLGSDIKIKYDKFAKEFADLAPIVLAYDNVQMIQRSLRLK